jgi:hypothetical protein
MPLSAFSASLTALVTAARLRGIEAESIEGMGELGVRLTLGSHEECLYRTSTSRIGAATMHVLYHRYATIAYLSQMRPQLPLPSTTFSNQLETMKAFLADHRRVALRPVDRRHGFALSVDITNEEELERAFKTAVASTKVLYGGVQAQRHLDGAHIQVLVIDL